MSKAKQILKMISEVESPADLSPDDDSVGPEFDIDPQDVGAIRRDLGVAVKATELKVKELIDSGDDLGGASAKKAMQHLQAADKELAALAK